MVCEPLPSEERHAGRHRPAAALPVLIIRYLVTGVWKANYPPVEARWPAAHPRRRAPTHETCRRGGGRHHQGAGCQPRRHRGPVRIQAVTRVRALPQVGLRS